MRGALPRVVWTTASTRSTLIGRLVAPAAASSRARAALMVAGSMIVWPATMRTINPSGCCSTCHWRTGSDSRTWWNTGMDGDLATLRRRQLQHVLGPPRDCAQQTKAAPTPTGLVRAGDRVAHLVANERLGSREQDGHQHLRPDLPGGNGTVPFVDHLRDHQIFEQVQAVLLAFSGDARRLRRRVDVERLAPERATDALPALRREHLRRAHDGARGDAEAPGE